MQQFGRLPRRGEMLRLAGCELKVLRFDRRRIEAAVTRAGRFAGLVDSPLEAARAAGGRVSSRCPGWRYAGSAVAFGRGMLLSLSFAPYEWWPLAIAMPALLMWLWEGASPRRAAVLGLLVRRRHLRGGHYWLYISLHISDNAPLPVALPLMVSLVAIMGAYHALLGWVIATISAARGARALARRRPRLWLLVEWLRGWFLARLRLAGRSDIQQTDTWLAGPGAGRRALRLGFLVLVTAGCTVALARGTSAQRVVAVPWSRLGLPAFALRGRNGRSRTAVRPRVAVVQGAIPQDEKWIEDKSRPSSTCIRTSRARRSTPISSSGRNRPRRCWLTTSLRTTNLSCARRASTARALVVRRVRAEHRSLLQLGAGAMRIGNAAGTTSIIWCPSRNSFRCRSSCAPGCGS